MSHAGDPLVWLEFWIFQIGIPYELGRCMPLAKLNDYISIAQVACGAAELTDAGSGSYFPDDIS